MKKIGKSIKEKRIDKGISQKKLAEGIVSQGFISKLEKGETEVSVLILNEISKKLDCTINDLLDGNNSLNENAMLDLLLHDLDTAILNRNFLIFSKLRYLYSDSNSNNLKCFHFLLNAMYAYYILNNLENALKYLNKAEKVITPTVTNELIFRVYTYSGFLTINLSRKKSLIFFKKAQNLNENYPVFLSSKLFFYKNYSEVLFYSNLFEESLIYSKKGIELAIKKKSLFYFEDLVYNYCLCLKAKEIKISQALDKSLIMFSQYLSHFYKKHKLYKFFKDTLKNDYNFN